MAALIFAAALPAQAGEWGEAAVVRRDLRPLVSYRAKLDGEFLVVQADHEEGWHTCAMDNKVRAEEKLAGRRSLGIDAPTEIAVAQGLELAGAWRQSPPQDFFEAGVTLVHMGFRGIGPVSGKGSADGGRPGPNLGAGSGLQRDQLSKHRRRLVAFACFLEQRRQRFWHGFRGIDRGARSERRPACARQQLRKRFRRPPPIRLETVTPAG